MTNHQRNQNIIAALQLLIISIDVLLRYSGHG